jgi:hypothetical protein
MFASSSASLDLVEEVESARPREERGREERDRAERLLAARQERQPRDALAGRTELDLDAGSPPLLGLDEPQPPSPPGKSVDATSSKCSATARTSRRSAARPSP